MLFNVFGGESIFTFLVGLILGLVFVIYRARHWQIKVDEFEVQREILNSLTQKKDFQLKNQTKSLQAHEVNINKLSSISSQLKEKNHGLIKQVNELVQYVNQLKAVVNERGILIQNLKTRSEEVEKINGELTVSLNKKNDDLKNLQLQAEKQASTINQMRDQASEMTEEIREFTALVLERDQTVSQLQEVLNNRDNQLQELMTLSEQLQERISVLNDKFKEKDHDVSRLEARIRSMQDDLTIISGIGPKVSTVLRNAGIGSFSQLAATRLRKIRKILKAENPSLLRLLDPTSWSKQAKLAVSGDWEALSDLQNSLKRKKREEIDDLVDSQVDQIPHNIVVNA